MKTAIELSLMDTNNKNLTNSKTTPPPLPSSNDHKDSSPAVGPLSHEPAKSSSSIHPRTIENLTVAPYEPFYFSSSNDKDIGLVLKNLKSVVFNRSTPEQISQQKVHKVCNFDLKEQKKCA